MISLKVFTSQGCGPCVQLKDFLKGVDVLTETIDIMEDASETAKAGVRGVPTVLLMKNGEEKERVVGFNSDNVNMIKLFVEDKYVG